MVAASETLHGNKGVKHDAVVWVWEYETTRTATRGFLFRVFMNRIDRVMAKSVLVALRLARGYAKSVQW